MKIISHWKFWIAIAGVAFVGVWISMFIEFSAADEQMRPGTITAAEIVFSCLFLVSLVAALGMALRKRV